MRLGLSVSAVGAGSSGAGSSAPTAPVLSLTSQANGSITVGWTNTGADTYRLYVGGALAQSGITGTMATASGLTNFQDYNITVRGVVGGIESADSNTVTAYPSYGPVTIPSGGPPSGPYTVPPGAWTVGTVLWGSSAPLQNDLAIYQGANGYLYADGVFYNDLFEDVSDQEIVGTFTIVNPGSSFSIWNGKPILLLLGVLTSIAVATTAGSASDFTSQDRLMHREVGASTAVDFDWPWTSALTNNVVAAVTRESSNPSVIVPSSTDPYRWNFVSAGTATLIMRTQTVAYATTVTTTTGTGTVDTLTGFASGSLRKHCGDAVDAALSGKVPLTGLPVFSTMDHAATNYVRNVDCWGSGFADALTALSPWNSDLAGQYAGILVSHRHVIFATHFKPAVGAVLRFVTADNVVVSRTLTALTSLSQSEAYYPDITVGKLDSDVPGTIAFARVLPSDWESKIPSLSAYPLVCANTDQDEHLHVREVTSIPTSTTPYGLVTFRKPASANRNAFYEDIIGGDSGNLAFLIVNGQLVLLTVWTFGGSGAGTSVYAFKSQINTVMSSLGGGYSLTDADLSSFNSY